MKTNVKSGNPLLSPDKYSQISSYFRNICKSVQLLPPTLTTIFSSSITELAIENHQ